MSASDRRTDRQIFVTADAKAELGRRKNRSRIPESEQIRLAIDAYLAVKPEQGHRALLKLEGEEPLTRKIVPIHDATWQRLHERKREFGLDLDEQTQIALSLYLYGKPKDVAVEEDEAERMRQVAREEIARIAESGREISVVEIGDVLGGVPVHQFDAAPCGPLEESVFQAKHAKLPAVIAQVLRARAGDWLVPAKGESMVEAGIADGALVLMRPYPKGRKPFEGDIVLVSIETTDGARFSTMKHWYSGPRGQVVLRDGQLRPVDLPDNFKSMFPMAVFVGIIGPAVGGTGTAKGRRAPEGGRPGHKRNQSDWWENPENE